MSVENIQLSRVRLACCSLVSGNCHLFNGWWRLMKALVSFLPDVVLGAMEGSMSKSKFVQLCVTGFMKGY